jgi:hypothetical protein
MRRIIPILLVTLFLGLGFAMVTTVAAPTGVTVAAIDVPRPEPPPNALAAIVAVVLFLMFLAFHLLRASAERRCLTGLTSRRKREVVAPLAPPDRTSALRWTAVPSFPVT